MKKLLVLLLVAVAFTACSSLVQEPTNDGGENGEENGEMFENNIASYFDPEITVGHDNPLGPAPLMTDEDLATGYVEGGTHAGTNVGGSRGLEIVLTLKGTDQPVFVDELKIEYSYSIDGGTGGVSGDFSYHDGTSWIVFETHGPPNKAKALRTFVINDYVHAIKLQIGVSAQGTSWSIWCGLYEAIITSKQEITAIAFVDGTGTVHRMLRRGAAEQTYRAYATGTVTIDEDTVSGVGVGDWTAENIRVRDTLVTEPGTENEAIFAITSVDSADTLTIESSPTGYDTATEYEIRRAIAAEPVRSSEGLLATVPAGIPVPSPIRIAKGNEIYKILTEVQA